ncbi:MAG: hypothetical protein EPO26_04365 [Chloroflexota bacterium]|nr:MAG: hypothetical protein EPO26_04365 [Chloroflexota bacterium]
MTATSGSSSRKTYDPRRDAIVTGFQFLGMAVLMLVMGPLAIWAGMTSEGVGVASTWLSMRQPLGATATHLIPASIQLWIATILGFALVIFGVILAVSGVHSILFEGRRHAAPPRSRKKSA